MEIESLLDSFDDIEALDCPNQEDTLPDWLAELEGSPKTEPDRDIERDVISAYNGMLEMVLRSSCGQSDSIEVIEGYFINKAGELKFVSPDRKGGRIAFQVLGFNDKLKPLIDYFVKSKIIIQLTIKWRTDGREIEVMDLIQGTHSMDFPRRSDAFIEQDPGQPLFRSIVDRLLKGNGNSDSPMNTRRLFTSIAELRMLLALFRETYPPEIVAWAEDNLGRCEQGSIGISSEERKHIHRALMYILNIDWQVNFPQINPIDEIKADLDKRFYGLDSVKIRILEIAAQLHHTHALPKWGVLLCGPAGTGKTSIAEAIAASMNLPLIRMDMSSITDPDTLTGTSRIYSNAAPGYVLDKLFMVGRANVVMCINELDKAAGKDGSSSPSNALLTLIDGLGFIDNYFDGLAIPTDGMFFVATCNDPDKISKPILDRFLRIDIPAYSQNEKKVILEDYIIPRVLSENRLTTEDLFLSKEAVNLLCSSYAVEPGVRDLQQYSEKIVSHYLLEKANGGPSSVCYSAEEIRYLLGPSKGFERNFSTGPGLVLSAFVYEGVARVFPVEAIVFPGSGKFTTINIPKGPVREFCTVAYLCARREINSVDFAKLDITVYVPQPIPVTHHNYIGIAVYAAITSAVGKFHYIDKAAFVGGVDLYGNTILDETDISPVLNAFSGNGITTVYAPQGSGRLIFDCCADNIEIIESNNMLTLIEMALLASTKES